MIFRIRNNLWEIIFVNFMNKELVTSNGDRVLGVCDNNTKTIFIADNQTGSKTEHIICHEITHAMCFEENIDIPYELEERLCNFMADYGREIIYIVDDLLYAIQKRVA